MFIEKWVQLLDECRKDKACWQQFAFQPGKDAEGEEQDLNVMTRDRLIIALQYHHLPSDKDLITAIFTQEILEHESRFSWGLAEGLTIAGFLLAQYREVENVWLFWRAKTASFDTNCGFDAEFLLSAGVEPTLNFIQQSINPEKERLLLYLSSSRVQSESVIADWFEHMDRRFPSQLAEDDLETLLYYAEEFGEIEEGRLLLDRWEKVITPGPKTLKTLYSLRKEFHQYPQAINAKQQLISDYASNAWDLIFEYTDLINLYRLNQQFQEAYLVLKKCDPLIPRISNWQNIGLIKMLIDTALDVCLEVNVDDQLCREIFKWAHGYIAVGCRPSPNMNLKSSRIAQKLNDTNLISFYSKKLN